MNELLPWGTLAVSLGTLAYTIYANASNKHGKKFADLKGAVGVVETQLATTKLALEQRVDSSEDRLTRVESDMKHLPDKDAAHRLELSISDMRGEIRALTERIKPIGAIADRIQDAVLEKVTHER